MYSSAFLAFAAFLLCLSVTPLVRRAALRFGLLDRPDFHRKLHTEPIARVGGIAVALSYVAAFGLFLLSPLAATGVVTDSMALVWRLLPAASLVFVTGLADDIYNLKPWQKLSGQIAAASLVYWSGVRILGIGAYSTDHWWWSFPITLLWLLLCTNAFNLIDGLDGLAAGLGFFAALTAFLAAILNNNVPLALATAPLAGCLLGFLRYNFNPASIFLGDSGSLLIGFLLGCYGVIWSQKSVTVIGMAAPLMALAIPLADTSLAIFRRFLRNSPIFAADRGHLHHLLVDRGLTPRRTALLLYGVALVAALFSLVQGLVAQQYAGLVLVVFCIVSMAGLRLLRLVEFDVLGEVFFTGSLRKMFNARITLRNLETALAGARTLPECWGIIRRGARQFGFVYIKLNAAGIILEECFADLDPKQSWLMRVPLTGSDYIEFQHNHHYIGPDMIGSFVDLVCRQLSAKRAQEKQPLRTASATAQLRH